MKLPAHALASDVCFSISLRRPTMSFHVTICLVLLSCCISPALPFWYGRNHALVNDSRSHGEIIKCSPCVAAGREVASSQPACVRRLIILNAENTHHFLPCRYLRRCCAMLFTVPVCERVPCKLGYPIRFVRYLIAVTTEILERPPPQCIAFIT